ncbi:MAG: hypothetical protein ACKOX3_05310 [Bacteroidota bacterium]
MKKLFLLLLIILSYPTYSSNLLGGEITCRNINGLMYETTLTIYRDTMLSNFPINYTITYCDSVDTVIATHIISIPAIVPYYNNGLTAYNYIDTIIFPFTGTFKVYSSEFQRGSVNNIANATSYSMYIDCMIFADGINSTPRFYAEPIILAQNNKPFTYNVTPYDTERDSLSWEFSIPEDATIDSLTGAFTVTQLPYTNPPADTTSPFTIDSLNGDINFIPNLVGNYQMKVKIKEWRNGVLIGYVTRDMFLKVVQSNNIIPFSNSTTIPSTTSINWNQGTHTPTFNLFVPQLLTIVFDTEDSHAIAGPDVKCYGSALVNTSASTMSIGGSMPTFMTVYFYFPASSISLSQYPQFVTFRVEDDYGPMVYFNDFTFRIFVSPHITSVNEINNETKSVFLKSIDMLGRETDPNLPGFRIDLYSDGKTKKVFRGE